MPDGGRMTIETANSYLDEAYVAANSEDGFAAGQYVLLAVTDSGAGMSREVRERAFEPFFTTKPTGMGTGLGLSMVYGFIKQSNGHIKIYSEPGEGTAIKLYFPRIAEQRGAAGLDRRAHIGAARAGRARQRNDPAGGGRRGGAQVRGRSPARARLYRPRGAATARARCACSNAESNISLLFTDVVLPGGMNGRQLADEARRRKPELKVLYATGYTRNAIIHQGRLDAEVELLTKPFTAEALARKVRQILNAPPSVVPPARRLKPPVEVP